MSMMCRHMFQALVLMQPSVVVSLVQIPQAVEEHIGQNWTVDDIIPLNGTVEEVEQLREAMFAKRAVIKSKRKDKKAAKVSATGLSDAERLLMASNAAKERSQVTSASQAADLAAAVAAEVHDRLASNGHAGSKRQADDEDTAAPMSEHEKALIKKFKASDRVPANATKNVYASIFMSSQKGGDKESYTCRSTSARGMNMT